MNEEAMRELCPKCRSGETMTKLRLKRCHFRGQLMLLVRSVGWIVPVSLLSVGVLMVLFHDTPAVSAQTGSSISSSSGPVSWDFGPVVAGTVTNVGIQDTCPPGMCDDHDLTVVLPSPAATFYQTMTAKLTITYTWTSTVPSDLDIFAISPSAADHGPGSPDDTSTGAGIEVLTVTDPVDGVWHIRSVAALAPLPTVAHAVVTFSTAARPTSPPPPPPAPRAPTFINYPAPNDCTG